METNAFFFPRKQLGGKVRVNIGTLLFVRKEIARLAIRLRHLLLLRHEVRYIYVKYIYIYIYRRRSVEFSYESLSSFLH